MAVDSVSGNTNTSVLSGSRTTIAENFDTFLNILTTQLKNQNPLDPLDTNQFTAQLVQFTGVEQQLKTNQFLESLLQSTQSSGKTDAVSYIGKEVTAAGTTSQLKDGGATWAFNAEAQVANATVTIKNANGQVVYVETGSLEKGPGNFLWTGKGSDGNIQPDGTYTIDIKGTNLAGNTIKVSTSTVGVVTAVDFSGAQPILTVGSSKILLSDVTNVKIPATTPPPADGDDETES
jgi:flagellar basal-body rod modification protein FlgD